MPKLLSTKEVAGVLSVSEKVVRGYIQQEGLPAIRLKRRFRIDEKDMNEWLNERKTSQITDDWMRGKAEEPIDKKYFKAGRGAGTKEKVRFKSYPGKVKGKLTRRQIYSGR